MRSVSIKTRCVFLVSFPLVVLPMRCCVHAERRGPGFTGSPVSYLPRPPNLYNCKVIGAPSTPHGWNPHPPRPDAPPPSLPPSIFNTRDTSPLPQHGAHMPVILNLIKETFETGNTRSRERRFVFCLSSFLPNWAASYFVFKNPLAQTGSRRPPLSLPPFLPRSLCLQKHQRKANESLPLGGGKEISIYIWVCVERDKTVLVMLIHRAHPWEPSEAVSHRVDGELTRSAGR